MDFQIRVSKREQSFRLLFREGRDVPSSDPNPHRRKLKGHLQFESNFLRHSVQSFLCKSLCQPKGTDSGAELAVFEPGERFSGFVEQDFMERLTVFSGSQKACPFITDLIQAVPIQFGSRSQRGSLRVDAAPHSAARASSNSRSRVFRVSDAARSNSARASARRPSLWRKSPRTLGSRW